MIVGGDEHDRQFVYTGKIHRFVDVALRRGAIAEHAYGDTRLLAQLEGVGNASGMRRLRSHGNAEREILDRSGEVIAPLVPSPEQQNLLQLDATPDQRAIIPIGGQQDVFLPHCTGYADGNRLLAERNGISPQPAGALQCNSLSVKVAQQHHRSIERGEQACIGGERGERPVYRAVWREVVAVAHLKARDHREPTVCHLLITGHVIAP